MSEMKLEVRPAFHRTLRGAVLKDVEFWTTAARKDVEAVREADDRRDTELSTRLREDLANSYSAVAEASGILRQVPAVDVDGPITIEAAPRALESMVEEAVRICSLDLGEIVGEAPLRTEAIREVAQQLDWWLGMTDTISDTIAAERDTAAV